MASGFWCWLKIEGYLFTVIACSIKNPVLSGGLSGLNGALAYPCVRHVTRNLSWESL